MIVVEDVRLTNFDEETTEIFRTEFERNVELGVVMLLEEQKPVEKEK